MQLWRWIGSGFRFFIYAATLILLFLGERSSSVEIRGCFAGFLAADVLTDLAFRIINLPSLEMRSALETFFKCLLTLGVIHYWGFPIPAESEAIGPGFIIFLLTAIVKITGFALRLWTESFD